MATSSETNTRQIIAIDIDDVVANSLDAVRLWAAELTGVELAREQYHTDDKYWSYYDAIWQRHGIGDQIVFNDYLIKLETDQSHVAVQEGAKEVITALKQRFDIIFLTSRPVSQHDMTRQWLDERIDASIPLYMASNPVLDAAARSKGEMCHELGVSLLIDDNIDHCTNALEYDVDAIVFGDYGWNENTPDHMKRCRTWHEVGELLLNE